MPQNYGKKTVGSPLIALSRNQTAMSALGRPNSARRRTKPAPRGRRRTNLPRRAAGKGPAAQTLAEQLRAGLNGAAAGALDRWAQAGLPERAPFRIAATAVALLDDAQLKELIGRACNGASTTEIMTTVRTQWIGQPPADPAPTDTEDAPRGRALLAAATAVELLTRLRPGLGLPPEKYAAFRRSLQAAS